MRWGQVLTRRVWAAEAIQPGAPLATTGSAAAVKQGLHGLGPLSLLYRSVPFSHRYSMHISSLRSHSCWASAFEWLGTDDTSRLQSARYSPPAGTLPWGAVAAHTCVAAPWRRRATRGRGGGVQGVSMC